MRPPNYYKLMGDHDNMEVVTDGNKDYILIETRDGIIHIFMDDSQHTFIASIRRPMLIQSLLNKYFDLAH